MALVSVKLTAADKAERKKEWDQPFNGDDYPYGMCLDLSDEMLKKLGVNLADFKPDQEINVTAVASVRSMNIDTVGGKTKQSLSLQIEQVELASAEPPTDAAKVIYGKD